MPPLNYTSTVGVDRTVTQMQAMLAQHGAAAIVVRYTDRKPSALTFTVSGPHGPRVFTLPCDVAAVHRVLRSSKNVPPRYRTIEQAERTAWRTIKDWLEAQLALVEAQMATLDQTMLPYLHIDGEVTLYELYRERELRAIEGPS